MTAFSALLGETLVSVEGGKDDERITFKTTSGRVFVMEHDQSCCEYVRVEDICGDFSDILGSPILLAEEVADANGPPLTYSESYTWTFYKLATVKAYVTIRWLGESNGYYGEEVDFREVTPNA